MNRVEVGNPEVVEYAPWILNSSGARWSGLSLERVRAAAGELPEGHFLSHVVVLVTKWPMHHELHVPDRVWRGSGRAMNSVQFFPAGVPHASRWSSTAEAIHVNFTREFASAVYGPDSAEWRPPSTYCRLNSPLLTQLILRIDRDFAEGSPAGTLFAERLGAAIVAELAYHGACGDSMSPPAYRASERIERVLEYIHANLTENLSLATLASLAGIGIESLTRTFKRRTGVTPHQYVLRERISIARGLLSKRDWPISQIALNVGFQDQSHFSKVFRDITGVSARTYRRSLSR
jgi:AraC family transcriptional regulator